MPDFEVVRRNVMDLIREDEDNRLAAIERSWQFYYGNHAQYFPRWEGEEDADYSERVKVDAYVMNFMRRIVDTLTMYLYGQPVRRTCEDPEAQKRMTAIWKRVDMKLLMQGVKTDGGVAGTAYIIKRVADPAQDPEAKNIPIRYDPVEPSFVTLTWDPLNPLRVKEAIIHFNYDEVTGVATVDRRLGKKATTHEYVEYITDDDWMIWIDGELQNGAGQSKDLMKWKTYGGKNPVEDVGAVFTVFRNYQVHGMCYGVSDIHDAIPLNLKLDERMTDEGSTIAYHGFPLCVAKGFDVAGIKRGPRRMAEIPIDGTLEYLTWDQDLAGSQAHCKTILRDLLTMGRLPEVAFFASGLGDLRSAPALELAFAPAREAVTAQQASYGDGERRMIQGDIKIMKTLLGAKIESDIVEVQFPQKFLPVDSFVEMQTMQMRRQLGLDTLETQLQREHPDWTPEQIAEHKKSLQNDPMYSGSKPSTSPFSSPGEKSAEQNNPARAGNAEGTKDAARN